MDSDLFDTFNSVLAEAQDKFVTRFRIKASVMITTEAGEPSGELMFVKHDGTYRLLVKMMNGETRPLLDCSLEMRRMASAAFEPLWLACEAADNGTTQKVLHAIGEVRNWLDAKRRYAP